MSTSLNNSTKDQPDDSQGACPLAGYRILLVEDSPGQQRVYILFLQRAGP
jgi:hypothetical protein